MTLSEELSQLGVSAASASALAELAATGVPGKLVVVHAPAAVDAPLVAAAVARFTLRDPALRLVDVHLAHPAGDRWTVDEVDQLVIDPSRMRPYERAHVVVADADQMSTTLHDHLLKTVEEPAGDTLFWFCVTAGAQLPATVRGRATHEVRVGAAPLDVLAGQLVAAGLDADVALRAITAAGGDLPLAAAAHRFDLVSTLERAGDRGWATDAPTRVADEHLLDLATLSVAREAHLAVEAGKRKRKVPAAPTQKGSVARLDPKKLQPADRAQLRRMVRGTLARWRGSVLHDLPAVETREQMRVLENRLAALHDAHQGLAFNTPLSTVVAATLSRLNA